MSARTKLVRLPPYNPRMGHLVKNLTWRGQTFTCRWKEVPQPYIRHLQDMRQPNSGARMFDIVDLKEAEQIEAQEQDIKLTKVLSAQKLTDKSFRRKDYAASLDPTLEDDHDLWGEATEASAEAEAAKNVETVGSAAAPTEEVPGPPVPAKKRGRPRKKQR